jgi:hypothetical protein
MEGETAETCQQDIRQAVTAEHTGGAFREHDANQSSCDHTLRQP